MPYIYAAYGICLCAEGVIPGLREDRGAGEDLVLVHLGRLPSNLAAAGREKWYVSPYPGRTGGPNLTIWRIVPEGHYYFVYDDGARFLIRVDGGEVWCSQPPGATIDDTAVYLRGPILGMVLRLRGIVPLHASVVAVRDRAVALVGTNRAGKSTLAGAFLQQGSRILADDLAALSFQDGAFLVHPGYPRLNLWPDAARALFGDGVELPRVTPPGGINDWWDKRYLDLSSRNGFYPDPLPLGAVYALGDRTENGSSAEVEPLTPQKAFIALTEATYLNYALDTAMQVREFEVLTRLVQSTPVRLATGPPGADRCIELCRAILEDLAKA
jgi:hypothetical protein